MFVNLTLAISPRKRYITSPMQARIGACLIKKGFAVLTIAQTTLWQRLEWRQDDGWS